MNGQLLFSILCLLLAVVSVIIAFKIAKHHRKPSDANYLELKEGDVIVIDDTKVIRYEPAGNGLYAVDIQDKESPEPIKFKKGYQRGPVEL